MKQSSKAQSQRMFSSKRKRMTYPKINAKPKRSIGSMNGGFDQALLNLGISTLLDENVVIEQ